MIGKRQRDPQAGTLVAAVLRCRLIASKTAGPANALFAIQWPSARAEASRQPACGLILNPCGHYRRHQPQVQRPSSWRCQATMNARSSRSVIGAAGRGDERTNFTA